MRVLCAVVTLIAFLRWSPSVAAAESLPRLSYEGHARCPSREDFTQQLLSRSQTIDALTQSQIRVTVVARDDGYFGRLDLVDPQGNRAGREFSGPTCSEVTQAMALVAAVIIDGSTSADSAGTAVARASPAIRATPKGDSPDLEPAKHSADAHNAVVAMLRPERAHPTRERWFHPFSLGAVAGVHTAISPEITATFGLSFGYRSNGVWGSPLFRLGTLIGNGRTKTVAFDATSTGEADFLWLAARTRACPVTLTANRMQLGPCALFELGALRGSGRSSSGEGSSTGWWIAPGVVVDWSVQIDPIALTLTFGVVRPLVREHFKFQPDLEVFRAPNLGLLAEAGVAWTF